MYVCVCLVVCMPACLYVCMPTDPKTSVCKRGGKESTASTPPQPNALGVVFGMSTAHPTAPSTPRSTALFLGASFDVTIRGYSPRRGPGWTPRSGPPDAQPAAPGIQNAYTQIRAPGAGAPAANLQISAPHISATILQNASTTYIGTPAACHQASAPKTPQMSAQCDNAQRRRHTSWRHVIKLHPISKPKPASPPARNHRHVTQTTGPTRNGPQSIDELGSVDYP